MIQTIIGIALLALGLLAFALQRLYSSVPTHELKRVAGRGDELARALHRASAYGASLRLFLWIVVTLALAGGSVLMALNTPPLAGFVVLVVALSFAVVVVPSMRLTARTAHLAATLAGPVSAIVGWLHPVLDRLSRLVRNHRVLGTHTGLFEKEDLVALLHQQKEQADNRISGQEMDIANRALHFDETHAAEIVTKRADLHLVKAEDSIGPILLEELHRSGQQTFIVVDADERPLGTLRLDDAVQARQGGKVADITQPTLCYVHEDYSLRQVLQALLQSGRQLAIVVNGFEEIVGAISLGDVMHRLLGNDRPEVVCDDRTAVAAYKPEQSTETLEPEPDESGIPGAAEQVQPDDQEASPETTEVVE